MPKISWESSMRSYRYTSDHGNLRSCIRTRRIHILLLLLPLLFFTDKMVKMVLAKSIYNGFTMDLCTQWRHKWVDIGVEPWRSLKIVGDPKILARVTDARLHYLRASGPKYTTPGRGTRTYLKAWYSASKSIKQHLVLKNNSDNGAGDPSKMITPLPKDHLHEI